MKQFFLIITMLLGCNLAFAQIGVNTTNPNTTLDVRGENHNGAVTGTDGVLVPRVNSLGVNGLTDGQLIYLIADDGINGFTKGFHYWNTTIGIWDPISSGSLGSASVIKTTANLDFGNFNGSTGSLDLTVGVAGAEVGDTCHCSPSTTLSENLIWGCFITSTNMATVRLLNVGSTHDPSAVNFNIVVTK